MPLSREELEKMEKKLKEAFTSASEIFDTFKYNNVYSEARVRAVTAVSTAASALLEVDRRLQELDEKPAILKLPTPSKKG